MKKTSKLNFTIILLAICFVNIGNVNAKVWRVNNNPGVNADFSTLQTAHDAANAGDTLYIEGSATSYGDLTVLKKLVLIGNGYFLSDNPKTQYNKYPSTCNLITFSQTKNSVDVVIATGAESSVIGISGFFLIYVSGVSFIKCNGSFEFNSSNTPKISSGLVTQCYGNSVIDKYSVGYAAYPASNIICTNNIFTAGVTLNNSLIVNNVVSYFGGDYNVVKNNIFTSTATPYGASNNQIKYNIFVQQQSASIIDATNKYALIEDVFVCYGSACNALNTEARYKLKAGSPAIAAGENGVDCGAFGNYQVSGIPSNMPAIYDINANPTTQDILNVTVKVKSH